MKAIDVIIPVFNEEKSIGLVLDDIPKELVREIIVVNNYSTDSSKQVALDHGAKVVDEYQKGYGFACLKGIEYLTKKDKTPDIVVFLDGDYSDHPEEMTKLVDPILNDDYDFVVGSRALGDKEKGAMLPQAIFGNLIATFLIKIIYKAKYTDLGPFRAIKFKKLIELDMKDTTFGWTVEMQLKAAKQNYKFTEVPVSYRKRVGVSKITGTINGTIKAGYKIIWTIFKYL